MERRNYPTCCTSMYCGKGSDECPGCVNEPVLTEFKDWKDRTQAKMADPIWSPLTYVSTT